MEKELLAEITRFLSGTQISETYFGKRACGNSAVIERLRKNKTITMRTAQRIRDFIAEHEAPE